MNEIIKDGKKKLQSILNEAADEISKNGADSLWHPEQYIIGAKIIIEINSDMITTVRYEKDVVPRERS